MPITVLLVDDELLARANMRAALEDCCDWRIVGECERGSDVLDSVQRLSPQVVFLDIKMPGLDGLQVSRQLMKLAQPPVLVFVTAFDQHAVEAFELCALDYLLKPFDDERLVQTIQRIEKVVNSGESPVGLQQWQQLNQAADSESQYLTQVAIRSVGKVQLVAIKDIVWMASAGNYVELHLDQNSVNNSNHTNNNNNSNSSSSSSSSSSVLHRVSLSYLEKHLDPAIFTRVHRTSIIRLSEVSEFLTLPDASYAVVLKSGAKVTVSQRYKETLLASLKL